MTTTKTSYIPLIAIFSLMFFLGTVDRISADDGLRTVGADTFFSALEQRSTETNIVVLDVRTPGEFNNGHAPGALNLDFYNPSFQAALSELDKDKPYFMYCNSGNRSGKALKTMEKLGFSEVYDLSGGWSRNSRRLRQIHLPPGNGSNNSIMK